MGNDSRTELGMGYGNWGYLPNLMPLCFHVKVCHYRKFYSHLHQLHVSSWRYCSQRFKWKTRQQCRVQAVRNSSWCLRGKEKSKGLIPHWLMTMWGSWSVLTYSCGFIWNLDSWWEMRVQWLYGGMHLLINKACPRTSLSLCLSVALPLRQRDTDRWCDSMNYRPEN